MYIAFVAARILESPTSHTPTYVFYLEESGFTSAIAIKKNVGDRDYNAVLWFSLIMSVVLYGVLWFVARILLLKPNISLMGFKSNCILGLQGERVQYISTIMNL